MIEWLLEPWEFSFMRTAAAMVTFLGLLGGMAGTIVVTQRAALQVESLAHALLPGLILAYFWFGQSTGSLLLGGLFAVVLTRLLSYLFSLHDRTDHTTGSAIVIGFNFSLGLLLHSVFREELPISLDHFILGDLLAVSWQDSMFTGGVVVVLCVLLLFFYAPLKAFLFDPSFTARRGQRVWLIRFALEVVVSMATLLCFQSVGLVLTLAILIVPAATVQLLAKHLWQMFLFAGLLGVVEGIFGLALSYYLDWPSTPPIIMVSVVIYAIVLSQHRLGHKHKALLLEKLGKSSSPLR